MHELQHSPRYRAVNRAIWLVGTAVVAAHGVALLIYGPGLRAAAEEAARQHTVAEHALLCDSLGLTEGSPRRERCLDLLLQVQQRHEQSFMVRTRGTF